MVDSDSLPADVLRKMNTDLPAKIVKEIEDTIAAYRGDYEERDFDYFEYIGGSGNEIVSLNRGTQKWKEALEAMGDSLCPARVPKWYDHLTGGREPIVAHPGWHFETFRCLIHALIKEILLEYCETGLSDDDDTGDLSDDCDYLAWVDGTIREYGLP